MKIGEWQISAYVLINAIFTTLHGEWYNDQTKIRFYLFCFIIREIHWRFVYVMKQVQFLVHTKPVERHILERTIFLKNWNFAIEVDELRKYHSFKRISSSIATSSRVRGSDVEWMKYKYFDGLIDVYYDEYNFKLNTLDHASPRFI